MILKITELNKEEADMQNDIGEHKLANPEKYESHREGSCGNCQRLYSIVAADNIHMRELYDKINNLTAEREFYFKLEADKQKTCQELQLQVTVMQASINFWMDEAERRI